MPELSLCPLFHLGVLQRGGYYNAYLWLCLNQEERLATFYPSVVVDEQPKVEEEGVPRPEVADMMRAVHREMER